METDGAQRPLKVEEMVDCVAVPVLPGAKAAVAAFMVLRHEPRVASVSKVLKKVVHSGERPVGTNEDVVVEF